MRFALLLCNKMHCSPSNAFFPKSTFYVLFVYLFIDSIINLDYLMNWKANLTDYFSTKLPLYHHTKTRFDWTSYIFPWAIVTSNNIEHNFRHPFLAQFFLPFHIAIAWSVFSRKPLSDSALVLVLAPVNFCLLDGLGTWD